MEKFVTVDAILQYLEEAVEEKLPISPSTWVDAGAKLNILMGEETDQLFNLQQEVAKKRFDYIKEQVKTNVSQADAYIETLDEFVKVQKQRARVERIKEAVRMSKVQGRLRSEEMRGY